MRTSAPLPPPKPARITRPTRSLLEGCHYVPAMKTDLWALFERLRESAPVIQKKQGETT